MKKALFVFIIGSLLLVACSNSYCPSDEAELAIEEMESLAEEWDDALAIANSSSRMTLSGPVGDLQEIKREAGDLEVPQCLTPARNRLENGMQFAIDGLIAFMGQEEDSTVTKSFERYYSNIDAFNDELDEILDCLPNCKEP